MSWQPIETCPHDGYFLVHEDGAIRALLRVNGVWQKLGYPAIIDPTWGDALVGDDAKRMLPVGYRLEVRDGCCENPTHWMPLPTPPGDLMSDLVKRLRKANGWDFLSIVQEGADRIEHLERVLMQAREALAAMQMEASARNCGLRICDESIAAIDEALNTGVER